MRKILEWKENPGKFIVDLLENPKDELLYTKIKEKLLNSKS
jgi:DNA helicase-2/ATP-dependent DNA helicase PcrA